ncbi:MAG: CPXCG motif-containing cysteine-rich protein [Pseudomonadota bacterium]|nr:CPXCG motif-containing cysteine-rich protein [Pseudomonadota bacterium]
MIHGLLVHCPYCGEAIEITVEASSEQQDYIEDCQVCCRPISVTSWTDGEEPRARVRSENE